MKKKEEIQKKKMRSQRLGGNARVNNKYIFIFLGLVGTVGIGLSIGAFVGTARENTILQEQIDNLHRIVVFNNLTVRRRMEYVPGAYITADEYYRQGHLLGLNDFISMNLPVHKLLADAKLYSIPRLRLYKEYNGLLVSFGPV